jgi:hypothetical protein
MDLFQICHLINIEGQKKVFSRDSSWWICIRDNPLPLLPIQGNSFTPQQTGPSSSSSSAQLPVHNYEMEEQSAPVVEEQEED